MCRCVPNTRRFGIAYDNFVSVGRKEKLMIRDFVASDLTEVVNLFYNTVHTINLKDYNQKQLDAWASVDLELDVWRRSLSDGCSLVATENNQIVGFGNINKEGFINYLYTHKDNQGRGIAKCPNFGYEKTLRRQCYCAAKHSRQCNRI
ncbi:MAG: GNAT family N-acetyltransferase [Saezia sp.]